ncbi:hypothetical protein R1A27_25685 [Methylobacterium sp. NMS12]|uniref:hypothetical protein n=1 Tax=Methylobacterium sp. NMS12 TaxID=3079766 RepID=UPI003F882C69
MEAVCALRACGHTAEPWSGKLPCWLVDGETLTDGNLLAHAVRLRLMDTTTTELR